MFQLSWQQINQFVLTNIWPVTASSASILVSIFALYFVFSRTKSPTSSVDKFLPKSENNAVEKAVSQTVTILIEKSFIRGVVREELSASNKPRFTFSEIVTYAVPAFIAISLTVSMIYLLIANSANAGFKLPEVISQAFTAIIAFYFGAIAGQKTK